jgi:transcriptional regulator with XRE-family HTH domain
MSDIIRSLQDAGEAVRRLRKAKAMTATRLCEITGLSRDTLHRLERGGDVSLDTFLRVLQGLKCGIELREAGRPTLEEMRRRFAADEGDDE